MKYDSANISNTPQMLHALKPPRGATFLVNHPDKYTCHHRPQSPKDPQSATPL